MKSGQFGQTAPSTNRVSGHHVFQNTPSGQYLDLLDVDVQKSRAAQNILEVNATSARDYKTQVLDNNKSKIDFIHAKQMANLDVSKTGHLHHIQKMLPKKYKEIFLEQQNSQQFGHTNLF